MTVAEEFDAFWHVYPRKIGKLDAMKAYAKARTLASHEELLAGVDEYLAHKPDYADWSHPSSWLNKGRWMDEYTTPQKPKATHGSYKLYVPLKDRIG